jgi:rubrerythrin
MELTEWTLERALDLAVMMEEQSIQLYTATMKAVQNPGSRQFLKELMEIEEGHKEKLVEAKSNPEKIAEIGSLHSKIPDLGIAEILINATLSPGADYQQVLIFAAQREKDAHDYYMSLAGNFKGKRIGEMFEALAQEEMKHKYRLESEYDEFVLQDM